MKVHIVCSFPEIDRILPRLARSLAEATGWGMSDQVDPSADLNYYFPYLELRKAAPIGPSAALFTHREDSMPGKVAIWEKHAAAVDYRITWAQQYADDLEQYGQTVRITPPLDRELFQPSGIDPIARRMTRDRLIAGTSGYVYSGGRKGERLLAEVMPTTEGQLYGWRGIGRGWPRPIKTANVTLSELPAFYQGLDLYVCSSLIEGIPYGPLEALACGIPIVIPTGVGILDELPDTRGIFRYEVGNAKALRAALGVAEGLLREGSYSPDELRQLTERFTLEAWVDGHLQLFGEETDRSKTARRSDHGIYVVAYGEPARDCAENLIASIRRYMPDTPVAVASDHPLAAADIFVPNPDEDLGGRAAKTRMWDNAPAEWEYVLYLDADTELTAPIPFLFDVLRDGWELVCTKDVQGYDLVHSLWRRDSTEHKLGWAAIKSDRALQLAGGVMGFRRTPAVQAFLETWYTEWFREARRDQGALLRALYANPVRLLVLGNHWNTFQGGICPETTAGIIHHRDGPARRIRGWIRGRLDDPALWKRETSIRRVRDNGRRGVEGVQRSGRRRHHVGSSVVITFRGTRTLRRPGRTGRNYIFPPGVPVTVTGEDAPHVASAHDPLWEVETLNCPVCQAPNGACRGDDIAVKESSMSEEKRPMRMPKQKVNPQRGVAGYIGEKDGLVETFERVPRSAKPPETLKDKLAGMTDDQLTILGVERAEKSESGVEKSESGVELHPFEANRGGVNCTTCRKSEMDGDHKPSVSSDGGKTSDDTKVVGERKEPAKPEKAAARHRP